MTTESIERRILGGLRFVDAVTGQRLHGSLTVSSDTASFVRNQSGDYVVVAVEGLEEHANEFDVPVAPPVVGAVPVRLTVRDPANRYLDRRRTIQLPRDATPANASAAASLFQPMPVKMYPSPGGPTWPGWAVVRATVNLPHALLRVVRVSDNALLGSGMSDARGEALIGVAGIPITTFGSGSGPVLETSVAAVIQVIADPAATGPPDPDDLEQRRAALLVRTSPQLVLASGRIVEAIV